MHRKIKLTMLASLLIAAAAGLSLLSTAPTAHAPDPTAKVAYVDFLTLLKEEPKLQRDTADVAAWLDRKAMEVREEYLPQVQALDEEINRLKVTDRQWRQANDRREQIQQKLISRRMEYEQSARADIRAYAIDAFKRLRNLTEDIARELGYNQVLNIVRDPDRVAETHEDIRALQQQLLISPVIVYDADHDITDRVAAQVKQLWGRDIKIQLESAQSKSADGGMETLARLPQDEAANPDKVDYEVRVGQTVKLAVTVTDKDKPAEGELAGVEWSRVGIGTGKITEDGEYTAPAEIPARDVVILRCRAKADMARVVEVRVRILDKDGKRAPAEAEKPSEPETPPQAPQPPKEG